MVDTRKAGLLAALALLVLVVFLSVSRAPALNDKAAMGTRTDITGIAFDQLLVVSETEPVLLRIGKNTVNWSYTNWKGQLLPTRRPQRVVATERLFYCCLL